MLEIKGLYKSFGDNKVLKGIDFHVDKGEVVAVIGPSGSGKTTLLRCISFLEKSDAGTMTFTYSEDKELISNASDTPATEVYDMSAASSKEIRLFRRHMGFVFQSFNLFKNKTALGNVTEGLITGRHMPEEVANRIAMEGLEKVGLSDRADYFPDELSGGQQQRVAIARAMALEPDIILFDEPTSALDPELTREVLDSIRGLAREGTTMVVVTHEMNFAREVASRVVFMEGGAIVEEGSATEVFDAPREDRTKEFLTQSGNL